MPAPIGTAMATRCPGIGPWVRSRMGSLRRGRMLPDRRYRRRSSDWKTKGGQHVKILSAAALVAAGLIALAGCQKATDSAAFEKQAKEDVRNFIPAFNTGDIDTIMEMYAPDAEVLAPANPRAVGHDAIRTLVEKLSGELQTGGVAL